MPLERNGRPRTVSAPWDAGEPACQTAETLDSRAEPESRAGARGQSARGSKGNRGPRLAVCFLIDRFSIGGTESQLLALVKGLDRARFAPHLCFLDGTDEASRSLELEDCPVLSLGIRRLRHPSTLVRAWRLARFLRARRVQVLETFFPDSAWFGVTVARLAGVRRVVASRRDLGYWMTPRHLRAARLLGRFIDATVANCQACRDAVIEQERARPASVVVLENGIDVDRFVRIPQRPIERDGAVRVAMVGNWRPVKGMDVLLRAAAHFPDAYPEMIFSVAGAGDKAWAMDMADQFGIRPRLDLRGQVRDIPAFLAELDIAVLPSYSEGLSNALLEYMAAARPIVATDVGAAGEVLGDGKHGLLVRPGDHAGLARAIAWLVEHPEEARAMGAAARQRAAEKYSMQAMVRRFEEFFLDLVGGRAELGAE